MHGMVEQEVTLTWDELLDSDLVEAYVTLACVSNPVGGDLIGNQKWLGLPITDLLARAKPDRRRRHGAVPQRRRVHGVGTPLAVLTDGRDALLAIAMDGEPLPVRARLPGAHGGAGAVRVRVRDEVGHRPEGHPVRRRRRRTGRERGWSPEGPIKTQSRIEVPKPSTTVPAGPVVVAGTAWAQHRGVTGVQVRVDDGAWNDATLADDGGIDSWRQWSWTWDAEPGEYQLFVRASDPQGPQTGAVQGDDPRRRHRLRHGPREGHLIAASVDVAHVPAPGDEVLDVGVGRRRR